MIPETIDFQTDPVRLANKWLITCDLAERLVQMSGDMPFSMGIQSGFRTKESQDALRDSGRPAAPDNLSTHRECPATGADLSVGIAKSPTVKALLGAAALRVGLRWGGGSPISDIGIPSDWNHVDLGPRHPR